MDPGGRNPYVSPRSPQAAGMENRDGQTEISFLRNFRRISMRNDAQLGGRRYILPDSYAGASFASGVGSRSVGAQSGNPGGASRRRSEARAYSPGRRLA